MVEETKYVPGVCNIDRKGRRKRAIFGAIILALSLTVWFYLFASKASQYLQLILFIPYLFAFSGIWQASLSFCVGNAARHQYEIGGKTVKITDDENIRQDRKKAAQVNLYSAVSALSLMVLLFLLQMLLK